MPSIDRKTLHDGNNHSASSLASDYHLVASPETLRNFSNDVRDFWCSSLGTISSSSSSSSSISNRTTTTTTTTTTTATVPVLEQPPSPTEFYHNFVAPSLPCIIRNAFKHDDGATDLHVTLDDLVLLDPNLEIVVDVTPDGFGDCVRNVVITTSTMESCIEHHKNDMDPTQPSLPSKPPTPRSTNTTTTTKQMFVKPEQRRMTLRDFQTKLRSSSSSSSSAWERRQGENRSNKMDDNDINRTNYYSGKAHGMDPNIYFPLDNPSVTTTTSSLCHNNNNDSKSCPSEIHNSSCHENSVFYYSRQNDCWRTEWDSLRTKCPLPERVACIDEAFAMSHHHYHHHDHHNSTLETLLPDAVNLWIGNEQAVSSMHKDPYENLFYVLSGEKIFTLCPPADAPFLQQDQWDSGTFQHRPVPFSQDQTYKVVAVGNDHNQQSMIHSTSTTTTTATQWCVTPDYDEVDETDKTLLPSSDRTPTRVRWIQPDIQPLVILVADDDSYDDDDIPEQQRQREELLQKFPLLSYIHPIQVKVSAGEMLYLPALWFHRVTQSCETVAINYWYDMKFNSSNWCYFNFLQELRVFLPS